MRATWPAHVHRLARWTKSQVTDLAARKNQVVALCMRRMYVSASSELRLCIRTILRVICLWVVRIYYLFFLVQCQVPVHQSIEGPAIRSKSFMRPGIDAEWHSRNSLRAQKARHACVRRRCNSFSQWPLNCSCTPSALNPVARGWRWMHVDPTCTKSSVVSGAVVHQDASSKWRDHPKGTKEFCTV